MTEWVLAQSGELVLREDGRLLASRFDPAKEAREWLNLRSDLLKWVDSVIVLGAGSLQAIREVLAQAPGQVYVVDVNLARLKMMQERLTDPRLQWIGLMDAKEARSNPAIRSALMRSFLVLRHPASCAVQSDAYDSIREILLARNWGHLNWQWRLRGGSDWDSAVRVDSAPCQPLSIYDLQETDYMRNSVDRDRMVFKALRELVK